METNLLMTSLPLSQLMEMIRLVIREEIQLIYKQQEPEQLISGNIAREVFNPKISKVTLNQWSKSGYIKQYQIGGRCFYKRSEIIEAAKHLKKYKRQPFTESIN